MTFPILVTTKKLEITSAYQVCVCVWTKTAALLKFVKIKFLSTQNTRLMYGIHRQNRSQDIFSIRLLYFS